MTSIRTIVSGLIICIASALFPARSDALDLPASAVETARSQDLSSAIPFPTGMYQGEATPRLMAEGDVEQLAYRLNGTSLTSFQLLAPLREQLETAGYEILFSCADRDCGGFDFRYLLNVLPEPAMHVDLGDFQYLLARHPDGHVIAVLTSRAQDTGFIQISHVSPAKDPDITFDPGPDRQQTLLPPPAGQTLATRLKARGHAVLDDLIFETGSSSLGSGPFDSLQALATYLSDHPETQVVLVGHTDNVGSLANNTALSRKRAEAVRERMIAIYGVAAGQIRADGIGYLAPRSTNATEDGRTQNRRVEAVIASTQ